MLNFPSAGIRSDIIRLVIVAATVTLISVSAVADSIAARPSDDIMNHQYIGLPQEKVYLHFDNSSYYHGDKIWFKAYVVFAPSNGPTPLSQTLYVELLNPGGKVIEKKTLRIDGGQCHGDFTLNQLPFYSGFYEVRAYTQYMMNFGDEVAFSRAFPVFDRPKRAGDYTDRRMIRNSDVRYGTVRPTIRQPKKLDVRFYPEGGDIIAGIPCRIAFEALGPEGSVNGWEGIVRDRRSDAVMARITPASDGRGVFTLLPAAGRSYQAEVNHDGKTFTFDLPAVKDDGIGFSMDNTSSPDTATVTIRRRYDGNTPTIGMILSSRGCIYYSGEISLDSTAVLKIDKCRVPTGVSTITLTDAVGHAIADRMFFVDNGDYATIAVKSDSTSYQPMAKVGLQLTATDRHGNPVATTLSVSVTDADNAVDSHSDILSGLLLMSDIKGYVANPSRFFSPSNPDRHEQLDLLMLTQGWRRYKWPEPGEKNVSAIKYLPEKEIGIEGQVVSFVRKKPKPGVKLTAALLERAKYEGDTTRMSMVRTFESDSGGHFAFDCDITGTWDLIMWSEENGKKKDHRIIFDRKPAPRPRAYRLEEQQIEFADKSVADKAQSEDSNAESDDQAEYQPRSTTPDGERLLSLDEVVVKGKRTSRAADILRNRSKSVAYYDMAEELDAIADNGKYIGQSLIAALLEMNPNFRRQITPSGEEDILYKGKETLFVINYRRSFLSDSVRYRNLYLESIKSIYINEESSIKLKYADPILTMKDIDRYGCVVFIETDPAMPLPPGKGTRRTVINGYAVPAEFYHPDYSVMPEKDDYRRTLYWNPDLATDANGKAKIEFYNNATCRKMAVDAQGISAEGVIATSSVP